MTSDFDVSAFLIGNLILLLVLWLVIYGICGAIAAWVAPGRRRLRFFVLTFFFLGPLGIGFAAIAPPGVPKVKGHWEFQCDRCGASQNVAYGTKTADCWRCGETFY